MLRTSRPSASAIKPMSSASLRNASPHTNNKLSNLSTISSSSSATTLSTRSIRSTSISSSSSSLSSAYKQQSAPTAASLSPSRSISIASSTTRSSGNSIRHQLQSTSLSTTTGHRVAGNPVKLSQRSLFIQTASTPNPRSLKFMPGKQLLEPLEDGTPNTEFFDNSNRTRARQRSTLAYTILCIEGVMNVMLGDDFVTVTLNEGEDWLPVKPLVFAAISDAFASGEPILKAETEAEPSREQATLPGDEEAVALIKEIIDLRIRPTVMDDGGDLEFIKFDENRVVWLLLKGSCSGCPSSGATLKQGIQNMIMHYVPEVLAVEEFKDQLATVSDMALQQLEERLAAQKNAEPNAAGTEKH